MIGHYVPKEVRDIGIAGFGLSAVISGAISNPAMSIFAVIMAIGAAVAAVNRIPDVVAELNGGVGLIKNLRRNQ